MAGSELHNLWAYLASSPLFHLTLTVSAFLVSLRLFHASRENPMANPVLLTILIVVTVLWATDTDYWTYFEGAKFVHFLLGPATVALAFPLYQQLPHLRHAWKGIVAGLLGGSITAIVTAGLIAYTFGASRETVVSIAPKSVTTPVAMGIVEKLGGFPSLTAVLVIITGIFGACCGPLILRWARVRDPASVGLALGVAAHGIGTARAFQIGDRPGAYAGLAMGLNALLTSLLIPFFIWLLA